MWIRSQKGYVGDERRTTRDTKKRRWSQQCEMPSEGCEGFDGRRWSQQVRNLSVQMGLGVLWPCVSVMKQRRWGERGSISRSEEAKLVSKWSVVISNWGRFTHRAFLSSSLLCSFTPQSAQDKLLRSKDHLLIRIAALTSLNRLLLHGDHLFIKSRLLLNEDHLPIKARLLLYADHLISFANHVICYICSCR